MVCISVLLSVKGSVDARTGIGDQKMLPESELEEAAGVGGQVDATRMVD